MENTIVDGRGTGNRAGVDVNGRLRTKSISENITEALATNGDTYNVNTGIINLTSSTVSSVLYFKNTGQNLIGIPIIGYLFGNSTGGTGDMFMEVVKNPTSGTIITNAVSVDVFENKNSGSTKTLPNVLIYKGVEGDTLTDGSEWFPSLISGAARTYTVNTGLIIMSPGTSMGIKVQPQTSNTSLNLNVFMSLIDITDL